MAYGRRVMYIKIEERWPIISHSFSYSQQWFVCVCTIIISDLVAINSIEIRRI